MLKSRKAIIGAALLGVVAVMWIGAFGFLVLFKPNVAQWTLVVTVAAITTEVAMWAGVALVGITALDRFRIGSLLRRK